MSIEGWGFADPWVFQEMSRIISFSKTEIPKMYETVHRCLDTNLNSIIHEKISLAIAETCNQIEIPLSDEQTSHFIQEVSQKLEMDGTSINSITQSIVNDLSIQMHQIFLKEKRNISPEIVDRHDDLLGSGEGKSA